VFQGRYKAILVERDSYLKELARYVVLNPVRAKRVQHPGDWPWSSYAMTAGKAGRLRYGFRSIGRSVNWVRSGKEHKTLMYALCGGRPRAAEPLDRSPAADLSGQ
jgi:hypothetical protein